MYNRVKFSACALFIGLLLVPFDGSTHQLYNYIAQAVDQLTFQFTNYVRGYQAPLDYIWNNPTEVRVRQVLALPGENEVKDTFCPSARFPSDHLAVVCDLEFA